MWSRFTGKSDSGSSAPKDRDDENRRRKPSESTRAKRDRDSDLRSVVSSTSTRKPSRRDTAPSSIASFATAFDNMPRPRGSDDLYEDPRDERYGSRPSSYAESSVSTTRRDRSRSRDRDDKSRKKSRDQDKDKKSEKRRSTRSDRSGSLSQAGGYRGDIVESPKQPTRSFSGQIASDGFSQFPGQAGAPLMSGALPSPHTPSQPGMSSHVQAQFPGQDPAQYASSALPGGNPFGAAADYYQDQGESIHQQPGVRPQAPSVIIGQDTPHLIAAAAQPNPVADTGSGAAADFYGGSTDTPPSKPPRPSTMPGAFFDDDAAPQKPPRPSSKPPKPNKPSKFGSAATMASGAALGYAMGHGTSNTHQSTNYSSSNNYQSTSYTNGNSTHSNSTYNQGGYASTAPTEGSSHMPTYSQAIEGAPPPKPPRPGKPEKQSSGSNAGLYAAAGAAGLAAYGLHQHNSHSGAHTHSHNHTSSTSGAFPGQDYNNGVYNASNPYAAGGMAQRHQHTGPVSRFVDWWKDYEDVQKMEEYTEYIGVCKHCFDPRSSVMDAPRKHHYNRRRSSEYMRPSGGIEKQSRYGLKEKKSWSSFSSGDEKRKKHNSNAAGWVAAGLGGIGLAKAGKAVLGARRDDFDDTYSIKSGRDSRSRISGRSRSRSRDRMDYQYGYGHSEIRRRSRSRDRMSQMSVGVTKDKKDYKVIRRHSRSRSRSRSSSRGGKSGFGTALGVGLAGAALGAAVSNRRRSRSRSKSPKKALVHHRRDSSDDERRRRRSQQLRRKSSRSSASGASIIDISQTNASQSGFFGGFFAAPQPKIKRKKSITASRKKKTKGFFNFGNASSSSSDSEMAFGTGYVQRRRRSSPKRQNSDERFKATLGPKRQTSEERLKVTLAGLGATAAAIAAAKAKRSSGKHHGDVVAVKEHRHVRKGSDRQRPASRYGDDEWEDLPDDDTSDSSSNGGLVYGDYDWRKGKSQESLVSNGSGTNKWGWRWGFGQKKRRSSDNLYDNIANTSFIGPATAGAAGAITGTAIATKLGRHDSESSSVHTLQTVYPVASNDPTTFDARRTSSIPPPQPLITSGPGAISLQQPQPMTQVPGAMYTSQAPSQPSYTAPAGPPVFSQPSSQASYPTQHQSQTIIVQAAQPSVHPPLPRRANSSPIQTSSWKRDAAIAGLAATAGAAAIAAARNNDRTPSSPSNVRFNLTKEQSDKDERERRREENRRDDDDRRRREQERKEEDARRDEENRRRQEQQLREEEARRLEDDRRREQLRREDEAHREGERRRHELLRQQEEARKYMEVERLAKLEAERRADERRRQQDEIRAREAREAEEQTRREREARAEAQRRIDQEAEAEQIRRERREAEQRDMDRLEARRRDVEAREAQEAAERDRIERDAQQYASRYNNERDQRKIEEQRTGSSVSSVATVVRRKEKELEEREREVMQPDTKKSTVASAVAAGAAAAITSAAISSYKGKEKEKEKEKNREREHRRDSSSTVKNVAPSSVKAYEPTKVKTYEPSNVTTVEPSKPKTFEPSSVVTYAPSNLQQDYADDDIFDPNLFKKQPADTTSYKKQTAQSVFQDWEERYNEPQVSQADFFAPKELLQNDNLPKVRVIDPNEGAANLTTSEAHDGTSISHSMTPPYPAAYSFVATRDGRPSPQMSWPVPALNLIMPTPPGSRAPSVRSASAPPSPAIEPVQEPKEVPKPEEANRARSRVSWGENQFHHFEVPTPDSYREQFVSDSDLKDKDKSISQNDNTMEHESSKHVDKSPTYQPYRSEQTTKAPELPEVAPSTQYVQDEKDSDWDNIVSASSKKSSKKEKKQAKAAAAAAAAVAAASVAAKSTDDWDDHRRDNASVISNPFSDSYAAASTIAPSTVGSSIYPSSSVYTSTAYGPAPDLDMRKGSSRSTNGPGFVEGEVAAEPTSMHIPGSFDEPTESERDTDLRAAEEEGDVSSKKSKKGKKKSKSTDDIVVAQDTPKRVEQERTPEPEPTRAVMPEPQDFLSKKEKKKRSKAAKRASVDSWEESDVSPLASPTAERDRDIEPATTTSYNDTSRSEGTSKTPAAAALAGGFAALLGTAMKQDQARINQDFEHARESFHSADAHRSHDKPSTGPPRARTPDHGDRSVSVSGAAFDEDDLVDAKTPRRKKEKRHSSGRWSPTIGSPLRTETKYEDYIGAPSTFNQPSLVEAPKVPTASALTSAPETFSSRPVYDSGYYAPDDPPRKETLDRDSDELFFSAGSDERERSKNKTRDSRPEEPLPTSSSKYEEDDKSTVISPRNGYDDDTSTVISPRNKYDDDTRSVGSSRSKYEDDPDREERHRHRRELKSDSRDQSRDRTYELDAGGERRRRHRRRETEDPTDDWDTRSTISEARSEANGERRRKHRRRESEKGGSPESMIRSRSSAASEPGDLYDDHRSSRRKSKRDDDDNASVISTSSRYDEDRSSKKEKEKRASGLLGFFSKSKENLAEPSSKSSKPREEEEEEGKRRRRKHRSDRGSTYGSDDDDARSTISSSSRREKRSSRSERDGDRKESYDEKVHRSSYAR
jgi:serine/arginine repetitive matrix protein 2